MSVLLIRRNCLWASFLPWLFCLTEFHFLISPHDCVDGAHSMYWSTRLSVIWSFLCSCCCGSPKNQNPVAGRKTMAGQNILKGHRLERMFWTWVCSLPIIWPVVSTGKSTWSSTKMWGWREAVIFLFRGWDDHWELQSYHQDHCRYWIQSTSTSS